MKKTILTIGIAASSTIAANAALYSENFDSYANGTGITGTVDPSTFTIGGGAWSLDTTSADLSATTDYLRVESGQLEAQDTDGPAIWLSQSIDLTGAVAGSVSFSLDASETGDHEASNDFFDVEYSIDGGSFVMMLDWNGRGDGTHTLIGDSPDDGDWVTETVTLSGLSATTSIQLRVTMQNGAGTEQMQLDNVTVDATIVPEPSSFALLGLAGLATLLRRKR